MHRKIKSAVVAMAGLATVSCGLGDTFKIVGPEPVYPGFVSHVQVLRDGASLAYYVRKARNGNGPTLVLVPGTHGDRSRYLKPEFIDQLDPNWGVVVIESRGQGRSWPPPTPEQASIEKYSDDVLEVADQLKLDAWYISGHSLGGMIAIEVAGRHPHGLHGAIPIEGWSYYTVEKAAFGDHGKLTAEEKAAYETWRKQRYVSLRWTPEEYASLMAIWTRWTHGRSILDETPYPVLTIWGNRNMATLPGRDKLGLPDRPNVRIVWIQGSNHHQLLEPAHAGMVAAAIRLFITEVEAAPASRH